MQSNHDRPQLRHLEASPSSRRPGAVDLTDPSGIAESVLTVSGRTLSILAQMNGRMRRVDIQAEFLRRHGRMLFSDELDRLIEQLDDALFLTGPAFDGHMGRLVEAYRQAKYRPLRDRDAFGAPASELGAYLDGILQSQGCESSSMIKGHLTGLVAPHLDYPRGQVCYARAYRDLGTRTEARRFIILGTNHFGRSSAVVGTRQDFETPWGIVPHDRAFMDALSAQCGVDLHEFEYDHAREHSVELQVIWLRHQLPDREFTIAPYLCPDICGPTGTAPRDGCGLDLARFTDLLRNLLDEDDTPTCIIAGADLSHVGKYFQDDRELSEANLREVESLDRVALRHLESNDPDAFRECVASRSNSTNICSVGCLFALGKILQGRAEPRLLRYHQAVTRPMENCVSCVAMEYVAG